MVGDAEPIRGVVFYVAILALGVHRFAPAVVFEDV
jgi:hypothetical protein